MRLRTVVRNTIADLKLASLHVSTWRQKPGSWANHAGYRVRINDGPNFYMLCKDIFIKKLYEFDAKTSSPRILDCGGNIGMSVLYFKRRYPDSRIVVFEPDPAVFPYLSDNVRHNGLNNVTLVHAAVSKEEGKLAFYSDGLYSSCLAQ